MKQPISMTCRPRVAYALACSALLALSACGGGGGAGSGAGAAAPHSFAQIQPAAGFTWSTSTTAPAAITLSRPGGVGTVSLLIAQYTCADATSSTGGSLAFALRTSVLTTYTVTTANAASSSLQVPLASLQLPAAAGRVLVEVVEGASVLHGQLVDVGALSSLSINVPASASNAISAACS